LSSVTGIVNRALRLLKANRVTSLTDGTNAANAANDVYTEVRDDLLRSHNWNFGTKRQKLAQSATAPTFEFDNAYPLPADWMRTISVHNNDAGTGTFLYREEEVANQGAIVTSADEVWIRYVYRVTDPNRMSADFRTALSYNLALAIPGVPNLSAAREERLEVRADRILRKAKHSDAVGSTPEMRPAGSWTTSRGGYPGWNRAWPD
jgi:hypothetical protein